MAHKREDQLTTRPNPYIPSSSPSFDLHSCSVEEPVGQLRGKAPVGIEKSLGGLHNIPMEDHAAKVLGCEKRREGGDGEI